ncbi:DNA polymerase II large subunit, partial [Dissostichus eleginoides]
HPPTSCQERAPSRSSEPANYCRGRLRHEDRLRHPGAPGGLRQGRPMTGGQSGSNARAPPPPHLNGSDKYEQLRATGSAWGGGGGNM